MKFTLKTNYLIGLAIIIASLLIVFGSSISPAYSALRIFSQGANGSCPNGYSQEYVDGGVTCYNDQDGVCEIGSIVCIADTSGGGGGGFGAGSITLTATPSTIDQGDSSTLSWTGSNLVTGSCAGTGFLTGGATNGSKSVSPNDDVTYSITCDASAGGTVSDTATVTVNPDVTPNSEENGGGQGGGGAACSNGVDDDGDGYTDYAGGDNGCNGPDGTSESENTPQCMNLGDDDGDGLVDLLDPDCSNSQDMTEGAASLSLTPDKTLVPRGQTATLIWTAQDLSGCTLSGTNGDYWELTGTSGSETTSAIQGKTTYTLTCLDGEDEVFTSATVKLVPRFQEQ